MAECQWPQASCVLAATPPVKAFHWTLTFLQSPIQPQYPSTEHCVGTRYTKKFLNEELNKWVGKLLQIECLCPCLLKILMLKPNPTVMVLEVGYLEGDCIMRVET